MKNPEISIIIIVKDDRGIDQTLAALTKQAKPKPTEIIVVDSSKSSLSDIRKKYPDVLWHSFIPSPSRKSSIPEQRNAGIQHAKGNIIVFIDANCIPSDNWLSALVKPVIDGAETMTAGSVSASNPKTYVNLNSLRIKKEYLSASPTINLAFKKDIWKSVGGFDESFLYGSDVDFCWRAIDKGNRILFVRDAVITHNWGTFSDEIKRSFKYGKARADLLIKHRERVVKDLFGDTSYVLIYSIYLAGLPLTIIFPWYPLTILLLVLKNIKHKPVKTVLINLIYTLGFWKELISSMM